MASLLYSEIPRVVGIGRKNYAKISGVADSLSSLRERTCYRVTSNRGIGRINILLRDPIVAESGRSDDRITQ